MCPRQQNEHYTTANILQYLGTYFEKDEMIN